MDISVFKGIKEGAKTSRVNSKESRQWNEIRKLIQRLETKFNKVINILGEKAQSKYWKQKSH